MNLIESKLNQISLVATILLFSCFLYAQESVTTLKSISGKITYLEAPLPDVNITIEGTTKGTKTDAQGNYNIEANIGDVLEYSHVSFKTVAIMIEDVTTTLNIEMSAKTNTLDEVVVKARKKIDNIESYVERIDIDLQTPTGIINPKTYGFAINHLEGERLNAASPSLVYALGSKFAGLSISGIYPNEKLLIRGGVAVYVLDGMQYDDPPIPLNFIKDIYVVKHKSMVIIVSHNSPQVVKRNKEKTAEQYTNQNFYNNDAVAYDKETILASDNTKPVYGELKEISGKITNLDTPLRDVNIVVKSTNKGTKTNKRGKYVIEARVGQTIQYSHIGFKAVNIIVEDVTREISIDMITHTNELDEVVVIAKTADGNVLKYAKKAEKEFATSVGIFDPKKTGYAVGFVDGEELSNVYPSIQEALKGKIAGYEYDMISGKAYMRGKNSSITQDYPVAWEVDGVFSTEAPFALDLSQVKSVHALKSLAATNKYGTQGAGGVIVIQTKNGDFNSIEAKRNKIAEQFTNKNYYGNDAISLDPDLLEDNNVLYQLQQETRTSNNPEILKAVAFYLQVLNRNREAIKIYEKVFKLRPSYAQSYRDLANAYAENDQYKKSWRLYMRYLLQGNDVSGEGIGELIYNEMEYLYFNRKNQTNIKEQFLPLSENLADFRNDVRLVFEWNTSEAEFDIEFVNPELRSYVFEHTLAANQELITDEKLKGYSSKSFFIDDLSEGEWLVNLTYRGNKKPEPTYFKLTTYYNWGKPGQRQETSVYKLENQRYKIQLVKFYQEMLLVSN